VDFVKNPLSREGDAELRDRVVDLAFERGLLTLGCGKSTIRVSPPLSITKDEIDEGLEIFEQALTAAEKEKEASIEHAA
jgi:4-aminobutyrate aminotransferase